MKLRSYPGTRVCVLSARVLTLSRLTRNDAFDVYLLAGSSPVRARYIRAFVHIFAVADLLAVDAAAQCEVNTPYMFHRMTTSQNLNLSARTGNLQCSFAPIQFSADSIRTCSVEDHRRSQSQLRKLDRLAGQGSRARFQVVSICFLNYRLKAVLACSSRYRRTHRVQHRRWCRPHDGLRNRLRCEQQLHELPLHHVRLEGTRSNTG
ncbi:hypothetical protein C8Q80DRAFT_455475 [Daedaleopsis nitida]|nr:hypothetical protein C8Q80DRAFT_455475 [Daedaleopsis nitida]